jgi:hypothetical protein
VIGTRGSSSECKILHRSIIHHIASSLPWSMISVSASITHSEQASKKAIPSWVARLTVVGPQAVTYLVLYRTARSNQDGDKG